MAASKKDFPLSITFHTVDRATSGIKRINDSLNRTFGPFRKFRDELGALGKNIGFGKIAEGFRGIGSVVKGIAGTVGIAGGAAGAAVLGFKRLVDEADDLGDAAERVGLSVDALYQLRRAAEAAGSSAEELDAGFDTFSKSLGQARAGTGRMAAFLKKVSPELLKQVKGAKSSEEAFNIMANAVAKIEDPAKRSALATAAFGGAGVALAPLLGRGKKGVDELRAAVFKHAGSQQEAADAAQRTKEAMAPLHDSLQSVKNSILVGLAPAFIKLAEGATKFLTDNREKIAAWIADFGEKLPGRLRAFGETMTTVFNAAKAVIVPVVSVIRSLVSRVGGAENAVKLLVGAWATFKGLQLAGHLFKIARGLGGIAIAALKAASKVGGLGGALSNMEIGGGLGKGGGKGRLGKAAGVLGKVAGVAGAAMGGYEVGTALDNWLGLSDKIGGKNETDSFNDLVKENRRLGMSEASAIRNARGALGKRAPKLNPSGAPMAGPMAGAATAQSAKVTIDIQGAPPGTRVTADPKSTADVDVSTGMQLLPGWP